MDILHSVELLHIIQKGLLVYANTCPRLLFRPGHDGRDAWCPSPTMYALATEPILWVLPVPHVDISDCNDK